LEAHGSETDLRSLLEPLFVKYGMDVVFAGHEHFYERVKPQKGIYYFTCGGSAKLRKGDIRKGTGLTEKGDDIGIRSWWSKSLAMCSTFRLSQAAA